MARYTGMRYSGLGYMSYGVPAQVVSVGRASPYQNQGSLDYGAPVVTQPVSGHTPPLTLGWSRFLPPVFAHPSRPVVGRVATGGPARWSIREVLGRIRPLSAAQTPQIRAQGATHQGALPQQTIPYHTPGPNSNNALFGRPGFVYSLTQPSLRTGPVPKLAPGSGKTSRGVDNRSLGFQPAGYGTKQHMPMQQFDYTPPNDPTFDVGDNPLAKFPTLPRTINVGVDGYSSIVGTYRVHDNMQADRFFKQGRSAGPWQDMSFGPNYRYLLPYQQVARYNLYNSIALARPLSPNNYFLGYAMQPAIGAQLGGALGQGRPLGY